MPFLTRAFVERNSCQTPMFMFSLNALTERYNTLKQSGARIAAQPFADFERQLLAFHIPMSQANSYPPHIIKSAQQLDNYLTNYETFIQQQADFTQKMQNGFFIHCLSSPAFLALKALIKQTASDFEQGKFWRIGLNDTLQLIEHYAQHLATTDPKQTINTQICQEQPKELTTKHTITTLNNRHIKVTPEELRSLEKGYYFLKFKAIEDNLNGVPNTMNATMQEFKRALINRDIDATSYLLTDIEAQMPVTKITSHHNKEQVTQHTITLRGQAPARSVVVVQINQENPTKIKVNGKGAFIMPNVFLRFGENHIQYYNKSYCFLHHQNHKMTLVLQKEWLFVGKRDPKTRHPLEKHDLVNIIRCRHCKQFMYLQTLLDNRGLCPVEGCFNRGYMMSNEKDFWIR